MGAPFSIYDTKGRLSHWTTVASGGIQTEGIYSYYNTGAVQDFWECTPLDCATVSNNGSMMASYYIYDLASDLMGYYPPGLPFQLSLGYDGAQRLTGLTQATSSWIDAPGDARQPVWLHALWGGGHAH